MKLLRRKPTLLWEKNQKHTNSLLDSSETCIFSDNLSAYYEKDFLYFLSPRLRFGIESKFLSEDGKLLNSRPGTLLGLLSGLLEPT